MAPFPHWLNVVCSLTLTLGLVCAAIVLVDVLRHPPRMAVMAVVWPLCALFGAVPLLWLYFRHEREADESPQPFPIVVARGTLHCGAGCTLGDVVAEWLVFALPAIAVAFGWHSVFGEKMYAAWVFDFLLAFGLGILFQYFAIVPMRHLPPGRGLAAAVKADALSLIAWQVGMYCLMGYLQFAVFADAFGSRAPVDSVEFWAAMQLAMIAGFVTAYPMNWWLIRAGIKERM